MADTPAPEKPKRRRTTKAAEGEAGKPKAPAARKPRKTTAASASAPAPAAKSSSSSAKPKPAASRAPRKSAAAPAKEAKPRATRARQATKASAAPAAPVTAAALVGRAGEALPEVSPRTGLFAALGTLAAVGGAFYLWRASRAEEPRYQTIESDGSIEIRKYPALVTAGTEVRGERQAALTEGFRTLADYLFARSREGKKLQMTAPVLSDTDRDGSWRTRFIMPADKARAELPAPPPGVELVSEPAARVAAIRFSGKADDATIEAKEQALRSWLQTKSLPHEGKATHAFYNAPFLPGPMRRNEVLILLSDEGGMSA